MTVEHGSRLAANRQGEFRDLVHEAKRAGVTRYFVWSAEDADFFLYPSEAEIEPPKS